MCEVSALTLTPERLRRTFLTTRAALQNQPMLQYSTVWMASINMTALLKRVPLMWRQSWWTAPWSIPPIKQNHCALKTEWAHAPHIPHDVSIIDNRRIERILYAVENAATRLISRVACATIQCTRTATLTQSRVDHVTALHLYHLIGHDVSRHHER